MVSPVGPTALCTPSLPMASPSPAAPGLTVEAVQNEELTGFGSDTAPQSAISPRTLGLGVQGDDVASVTSVLILPNASAEEGALAEGGIAMLSMLLTVRS